MKKILVVDDQQDICALVKKCLERTGLYQVIATSMPEEVLTICSREKPDLILLDIVMPKLEGTEIIKVLKDDPETKDILIMVTSGYGEMVYSEGNDEWRWLPNTPVVKGRSDNIIKERGAEKSARAYGVDDYLAKPFSPATLISAIAEVLGKGGLKEGED